MAKLPKFNPASRYQVTLKSPITVGRFKLRVQDKHELKGSVAEEHKVSIDTATEIKG